QRICIKSFRTCNKLTGVFIFVAVGPHSILHALNLQGKPFDPEGIQDSAMPHRIPVKVRCTLKRKYGSQMGWTASGHEPLTHCVVRNSAKAHTSIRPL